MKDITSKDDYDGVTAPAPATEIHTADEYNDRRVEMQGAVEDSAQTLAVADPTQLSKALFAYAVGAQSMQDNGSAGTIQLTPITGASGLRVATPVVKDYSLLDGAVFVFKVAATNAGNVTVNVGQTVGTYIGAVPLFLEDGTTEIPAGSIVADSYYTILYDSALDGGGGAFIVIRGIDLRALSVLSDEDDNSDAMVKDNSYLANSDGQLVVTWEASGSGHSLFIYAGSSDDPEDTVTNTRATVVGPAFVPLTVGASVIIADGEYFTVKLGSGSSGTPILRWRSFGALIKPTDQEA
jgi:hypothetical protein